MLLFVFWILLSWWKIVELKCFCIKFKSYRSVLKKKNVGKVSFLGFIVVSNNFGVCVDVNYENVV